MIQIIPNPETQEECMTNPECRRRASCGGGNSAKSGTEEKTALEWRVEKIEDRRCSCKRLTRKKALSMSRTEFRRLTGFIAGHWVL